MRTSPPGSFTSSLARHACSLFGYDLSAHVFVPSNSDTSLFLLQCLGKLHVFLGLEVSDTDAGLTLTQRKYSLGLLRHACMLKCKTATTPTYCLPMLVLFLHLIDGATEYCSIIGGL